MKRSLKGLLVGFGFLLSISLLVTGCGSTNPGMTSNEEGGSQLASNVSTGGDSVGKATVTFSAKFPEKGEVVKSLIDEDTATINVWWYGSCGYGNLELTPDNPSGTVELSPGDCYFYAEAFDSEETILDHSGTAGTLAIGPNTVVITFLKGQWNFVGDDGITPTPVNLTGGESLGGFLLSPHEEFESTARKGSIDPDKPFNWNDYSMTWFNSDGILFTNNTYLEQVSQFKGGTAADSNESVINGGDYNLTRDMGEWGEGEEPPTQGDRLIIIAGATPGDEHTTFNPDITPYFTSGVVNGETLEGNIFEATFQSESSTPADPPTGVCGEWEEGSASSARAAALNRALSGPAKASTSIGDVEVSFPECGLVGNDADQDGSIAEGECNYYDWDNDGIDDSRSCWDQNNDGTVDYGEYDWVEYLVTETYTDVWVHPFVAKGSQFPSTGTDITVQKR